MVRAGLVIPNFDDALQLLKRLDLVAESAKVALAEFLEILDADPSFYSIALKEVYEDQSLDFSIDPLEGALEVLQELSGSHRLAIVTIGRELQQLEKLKKAGIDSGIFSKIIVSEVNNKKVHYQALADELGYTPEEILVCGDKIPVDLAPAHELGYKTVHMRRGRGLNSIGLATDVDYKVSFLYELKEILSTLTIFGMGN